ncbi:MAG: hypothetical protein ABIK37_04405 [candidate division WOR-3 bacterium]
MSTRSLTRTLAALGLLYAFGCGQWVTTSTDTLTRSQARKWVSMQAISCDSSGCLHAVWTEATSTFLRNVMYARKPADSGWTRPEVIAESANNHAALAVEPNTGHVHVTWTVPVGSTADVMYATNRTGTWVKTRLTDDSLSEWLPTIALEDDKAHVAWIVQTPDRAYHIAYATNRSGAWQPQTLWGSQLGGFGSGASPWVAVEPSGIAHITYRGGDYPAYRVHHAQNRIPGDTVWYYEVLGPTENDVDYVSAVAARDSGELFVVVSGNDGWGFPWTTSYLHRPRNSTRWDQYQLMTASASACMRGFAMDHNFVHCTWERINGNINTEEIYHCSNFNGYWFNSGIRTDGISSTGALVIDPRHCGHALILVGSSPDSSQVYCVNSAPLTGIENPSRPLPGSRPRARLTRSLSGAGVYFPDGRQAGAIPGRRLPAGLYFVRTGFGVAPFMLVR